MRIPLKASSLFAIALICAGCATGTEQPEQSVVPQSDVESPYAGDTESPGAGEETAVSPDSAPVDGDAQEDWESLLAEYGDEYAETGPSISDPLRPWNKVWFHFNDKLYFWFIRPVSKGYAWVVPEVARRGVDNAYDNIRFPIRCLSSVFQARFGDAGVELSRFCINTTVGVAGVWDAADDLWEIKRRNEDFDQAFGSWGVGTGWYLVWPLMGPSSARGTVGMVFDKAADPLTYLFLMSSSAWVGTGVNAFDQLNHASMNPDAYADLIQATADPYSAVRDAYVQNRQKLVEE